MFSDKKEQEMRYQICKSCEEYIESTDQCNVCMCFMSLKTRLKNSSCPKGKWGNNTWW